MPESPGRDGIIRVMWQSRHAPTREQLDALSKKLATDGQKIVIDQITDTFSSGKGIVDHFEKTGADEMVVVLPIHILAELIQDLRQRQLAIHPIRAVMTRSLNAAQEAEFSFDHFERVLDVQIVCEPL